MTATEWRKSWKIEPRYCSIENDNNNFSENVFHAAHLIINKHHKHKWHWLVVGFVQIIYIIPMNLMIKINETLALMRMHWKMYMFFCVSVLIIIFWRCSEMFRYLDAFTCGFVFVCWWWITWKNTFQAETKREVDVRMWKCFKMVNINGSFECMINSLMGNHRYLMPDVCIHVHIHIFRISCIVSVLLGLKMSVMCFRWDIIDEINHFEKLLWLL